MQTLFDFTDHPKVTAKRGNHTLTLHRVASGSNSIKWMVTIRDEKGAVVDDAVIAERGTDNKPVRYSTQAISILAQMAGFEGWQPDFKAFPVRRDV